MPVNSALFQNDALRRLVSPSIDGGDASSTWDGPDGLKVGLENGLGQLLSDFRLQVFDGIRQAPIPIFQPIGRRGALVQTGWQQPPDLPGQPTQLAYINEFGQGQVLSSSRPSSTDLMWASDHPFNGFIWSDLQSVTGVPGLLQAYAGGVRVHYQITGSGRSSVAKVYAIELPFDKPGDLDDIHTIEGLRLIFSQGLEVRPNPGVASGAISTNPITISGSLNIVESVTMNFGLGGVGSDSWINAKRYEFSGLQFTASSGTASVQGVPILTGGVRQEYEVPSELLDWAQMVIAFSSAPIQKPEFSPSFFLPSNQSALGYFLQNASSLTLGELVVAPILGGSAAYVSGTKASDLIAVGAGTKTIDLTGDGLNPDESDTVFVNIDDVRMVDLAGNPSGGPLTGSGVFHIKGDSGSDVIKVGLRTLAQDSLSASQPDYALERLVVAGPLAWIELTDTGRELVAAGHMSAANVMISTEGLYSSDFQLVYLGYQSNSAIAWTGAAFASQEFLGGDSTSNYVTVRYPTVPAAFTDGRLDLSTSTDTYVIDSASGLPNARLDLDLSEVSETFYNTAGILRFLREDGDEAVLIAPGAVRTIGFYDANTRSTEVLNLVAPVINMAQSSLSAPQATMVGTNSNDLMILVEGLRLDYRGGAGDDFILTNSVRGSVVSGGTGFNRLSADDDEGAYLAARATTVSYADANSPVWIHLELGVGTHNQASDWLEGIWTNVIGSAGDDTIIGNEYGNELHGGAGNDQIYALQKRARSDDDFENALTTDRRDYLFGGTGDDRYFVSMNEHSAALVHERLNEGTDTIELRGDGLGLGEMARVLASRDGYQYTTVQGATDSWNGVVKFVNTGTGQHFMSMSQNIEKFVITGSNDFRNSYQMEYSVAYGNGAASSTGNDIVLPWSTRSHVMNGGAGNDLLVDSVGRNLYLGGTGDDAIFVSSGGHRVIAGQGNDTVWISPLFEDSRGSLVHLGTGNDTVVTWLPIMRGDEVFQSLGYTPEIREYEINDYSSSGPLSSGGSFTENIFGRQENTSVPPNYSGGAYTPYTQSGDPNQFGRLFAQSQEIGRELVTDIFKDWDPTQDGGGVSLYDRNAVSTVLDFRVDEDRFVIGDLDFLAAGPDRVSLSFTDGEIYFNRFFEKEAPLNNGGSGHGVVMLDRDSGRLGLALLGFVDSDSSDDIEATFFDLAQVSGLAGSTATVAKNLFEQVGGLGYKEVSQQAFLIGLPAIDQGSYADFMSATYS